MAQILQEVFCKSTINNLEKEENACCQHFTRFLQQIFCFFIRATNPLLQTYSFWRINTRQFENIVRKEKIAHN